MSNALFSLIMSSTISFRFFMFASDFFALAWALDGCLFLAKTFFTLPKMEEAKQSFASSLCKQQIQFNSDILNLLWFWNQERLSRFPVYTDDEAATSAWSPAASVSFMFFCIINHVHVSTPIFIQVVFLLFILHVIPLLISQFSLYDFQPFIWRSIINHIFQLTFHAIWWDHHFFEFL